MVVRKFIILRSSHQPNVTKIDRKTDLR